MASSLALKRLVSSNLLSRSSGRRLFSSKTTTIPVHDLVFDAHSRREDGGGYFCPPGGLRLQMDMPELGKEDVNVSVEHNCLTIEGQGVNEFAARRYSTRVDLPADKLYDIKAEVEDGVLTVVVSAEEKVVVAEIKEKEKEEEQRFDDLLERMRRRDSDDLINYLFGSYK